MPLRIPNHWAVTHNQFYDKISLSTEGLFVMTSHNLLSFKYHDNDL